MGFNDSCRCVDDSSFFHRRRWYVQALRIFDAFNITPTHLCRSNSIQLGSYPTCNKSYNCSVRKQVLFMPEVAFFLRKFRRDPTTWTIKGGGACSWMLWIHPRIYQQFHQWTGWQWLVGTGGFMEFANNKFMASSWWLVRQASLSEQTSGLADKLQQVMAYSCSSRGLLLFHSVWKFSPRGKFW